MNKLILLLSVAAIALPSVGYSQRQEGIKRVRLEMNGAHYRGRGNIIPLKRTLKQHRPNFPLERFNLVRVRLVAKSKHGGGTATLLTARSEQDRRRIAGSPREFRRPGNYHRSVLRNQDVGVRGAWQLRLDGNIKVQRVVLIMERKFRPRPRPGRVINICEHRPDPFKTDKKTCSTDKYASGIQIVVEKSSVGIDFVDVTFGNGQTQRLHRLSGEYGKGQVLSAQFRGERRVVRIRVGASSPSVFKKSRLKINLIQ